MPVEHGAREENGENGEEEEEEKKRNSLKQWLNLNIPSHLTIQLSMRGYFGVGSRWSTICSLSGSRLQTKDPIQLVSDCGLKTSTSHGSGVPA